MNRLKGKFLKEKKRISVSKDIRDKSVSRTSSGRPFLWGSTYVLADLVVVSHEEVVLTEIEKVKKMWIF
jgi:hypothetical protein